MRADASAGTMIDTIPGSRTDPVPGVLPLSQAVGRRMGSDVEITVVGGAPDLAARAIARISALEATWTRFDPQSELMRLNRSAGRPTTVSADLFLLVTLAVDAWHLTSGRFDPTIHDALVALGYDRSFELVAHVQDPSGTRRIAVPAPGCLGITLDAANRTITLPPAIAIDPGGLGKGLAADLVAAEVIAAGADGALVSIGGDVRVTGVGPTGHGWAISVADPFDADRDVTTLYLDDGAVATSSRLRRRWEGGHHVVDPVTARPVGNGLAAVTAVAADAATAEVATTSAFVAGPALGANAIVELGAAGLLFTDAGSMITAGPIAELLP